MRNDDAIMIRYMGADHARRYVLQRADRAFWTGDGWSKILDCARVFTTHRAAGVACAGVQYRRHKGKPVRTFTVEVAVTLAADEVDSIPVSTLVAWLAEAVRLDVENSVFGDGPVGGSFVQTRMNLKTLKETPTRRRVF